MRNTIMTEKIARRGILTPHTYKPDLLESVSVKAAMLQELVMISQEIRSPNYAPGWQRKQAGKP